MIGSMNEERTERARRFVDAARTDTVTERLLVGGDEYTGEFFLYGDPPIERLWNGEQPQAMLFNDMKGVGVGSKRDTVTPDGSARSVFVVTDDRVLLLVGQEDGDWMRSVPLADVASADYHTGFMKHRIVVDASDSRYHLWVDASYEEAELEATVALVEAGGERPSADSLQSTASGPQVGDGSEDASRTSNDETGSGLGAGDGVDERAGGETRDDGAGSARGGASGARGSDATDGGTGFGAGGANAGTDAVGEPGTRRDGNAGGPDRAPGGSTGPIGGSGDDGDDSDGPLETLERLKELHEKDVLTDEEFEAKKADILDQI